MKQRRGRQVQAEAQIGVRAATSRVDVREISLTFETWPGNARSKRLSNVQSADRRWRIRFLHGPSGCVDTMLRVQSPICSSRPRHAFGHGVSAEQRRLERRYGYVFQAPALFPWPPSRKISSCRWRFMGFSDSEQRQRAARLSGAVNLTGFSVSFPGNCPADAPGVVERAGGAVSTGRYLLMESRFGALDEIVALSPQLGIAAAMGQRPSNSCCSSSPHHSGSACSFLSTQDRGDVARPGRIIDSSIANFRAGGSLVFERRRSSLKSRSACATGFGPGILDE